MLGSKTYTFEVPVNYPLAMHVDYPLGGIRELQWSQNRQSRAKRRDPEWNKYKLQSVCGIIGLQKLGDIPVTHPL